MHRRNEIVIGVLAGVLGLALLVFVVFGPSYGTSSTDATTGRTVVGTASMVQIGLDPRALAFILAMGACMVAVAVASFQHGRGGSAWLRLLYVGAGLLVVGVFLSIASIGILLLPSTALAVVAAVMGRAAGRHSGLVR